MRSTEDTEEIRPVSPPVTKGAAPSLLENPSLSRESIDGEAVARPSLYRHQPTARLAPLEQYYGGPGALRSIDPLEELKSSRLEGLYNLSFIFLIFSLLYLAIRNIVEIGFQAGPKNLCPETLAKDAVQSFLFLVCLPPWLLASYALIFLHAKKKLSAHLVYFLHIAGLCAYYVSSTAALVYSTINPTFAIFLGVFIVVVSLKQHSYVLTNLLLAEETAERRRARHAAVNRRASPNKSVNGSADHSENSDASDGGRGAVNIDENVQSSNGNDSNLRQRRGKSAVNENTPSLSSAKRDKKDSHPDVEAAQSALAALSLGVIPAKRVAYPKNITLTNFVYYCVSPTLVYETSYPRTARVRPRYVIWYLLQAGVCLIVQYFLLMQFCVPVWRSARDVERMWYFFLKLALPSFICWLIMFWGFFHCILNVIAELTRFADRQFYMDWWNATTLDSFWRKWNTLVHEWCLRHVYVESMSRHNVKANTAALGTFLCSAFLHEYVCLVGFRMLRPYMFTGMLLQVPLMSFSRRLDGTREGNMLMWSMLFVGQSVIMLLYAHDYLAENGTLMC